jgi:hypothetical protein
VACQDAVDKASKWGSYVFEPSLKAVTRIRQLAIGSILLTIRSIIRSIYIGYSQFTMAMSVILTSDSWPDDVGLHLWHYEH